jgi:Lysyl oxidase
MRTRVIPRIAFALTLSTAASCKHDAGSAQGATGTDSDVTTSAVDSNTMTGVDTEGSPGAAAPTPTLMAPVDGAQDVEVDAALCWNLVDDPDGDAVRYRVYVDGIELMAGRLSDEGYEGPCLPRLFNHEQSYQWQVRAFNPQFPDSESELSEAWTFTTGTDGFTHTVFEDPFDDDLGWEIGGDASSGAWTRGDPEATMHFAELAQPGACFGGASCYFTGHNPDGIVDAADVSGGSTTLTSPEFDLTGNEAATVELSRFFYKSESETGTLLKVELLTPDTDQPDGYFHHTLEQLEGPAQVIGANTWSPVEYAACGLPMVAGTRLRITATDLGEGIVEGGIDSVSVRAHNGDGLCDGGEGSVCDPNAGDAACADGLLCCSQGAVNAGVYRCAAAEAGLDYDMPPEFPDDPGNGLLGCAGPDIFVDESELEPVIGTINVGQDSCELIEMCVGGTGLRTVLRFNTLTPNIGSRDMAMGVPSNHPDLFHYSDCHNHYHFDHYAGYELLDQTGVVATGHKQAFCLIDLEAWAWPDEPREFDCGNQGISRGYADVYGSYLPCQWIDITDVPAGTYTLRIALNTPPPGTSLPIINESNYGNNIAEVEVEIP